MISRWASSTTGDESHYELTSWLSDTAGVSAALQAIRGSAALAWDTGPPSSLGADVDHDHVERRAPWITQRDAGLGDQPRAIADHGTTQRDVTQAHVPVACRPPFAQIDECAGGSSRLAVRLACDLPTTSPTFRHRYRDVHDCSPDNVDEVEEPSCASAGQVSDRGGMTRVRRRPG